MNIIGFMRVFVTGMSSGGDVQGYVVGVSGCHPPDDWNIDPTEGGPYGIPLRLVRPAT